MTINRDWVTVKEYAERRGTTISAVYMRMKRERFPAPYVQVDGANGMILIHDPGGATRPVVNGKQKKETKSQVNFPQTACDSAANR